MSGYKLDVRVSEQVTEGLSLDSAHQVAGEAVMQMKKGIAMLDSTR